VDARCAENWLPSCFGLNYEGLEKWLYLARLVYRQAEGTELPPEWIHESALAVRLLVSAEGQLIFSFDPELNDKDEPIRHPRGFRHP
jgi:hypothetical protein